MKQKNKPLIFTGLIFLFLLSCNSFGQLSNSTWPIYQHDIRHSGQATNPGLENPTLAWKMNSNSGFNGSPTLDSEGVIYIPGLDQYLYAYYPQGKLKWKFKGDSNLSGAPTISSDGTIYVGSTTGPFGDPTAKLYAINPDGSMKWAVPLNGKNVLNCAIGLDGTIYVGSYDDNENKYKINALYPSGGQKWVFDLVGPPGTPSIGSDGTIYVVAGTGSSGPYSGAFYAFNPDGTLKWRTDNIGGLGQGYVFGPDILPVIAPDGSIMVLYKSEWVAQAGFIFAKSNLPVKI